MDYADRLQKGASYARDGHVQDIEINSNQVVAKVAEDRPTPYN
jgi:uncharacterized Zn finger protein